MTVGESMNEQVFISSVQKIAKELERANRLKAIEVYLMTDGKMTADVRRCVADKIVEIMK